MLHVVKLKRFKILPSVCKSKDNEAADAMSKLLLSQVNKDNNGKLDSKENPMNRSDTQA